MKKSAYVALALLAALFLLTGCVSNAVIPEVTVTPGWTSVPTPTDAPFAEQWITLSDAADETLLVDLDGDGARETVRVTSVDSTYTVSVESPGRQAVSVSLPCEYLHCVAAVDAVPGDGFREILTCADVCSDDYETVCFRYDGQLRASEAVAGVPLAVRDGELTVSDRTDLLGTRFVEKQYAFSGDVIPALRLVEGYLWPYEGEHTLKTVRELPVELIMDETYLPTLLPAGEELIPSETDGESVIYFLLADGTAGRILFTKSDTGLFEIDGRPEADYFEEINYAD